MGLSLRGILEWIRINVVYYFDVQKTIREVIICWIIGCLPLPRRSSGWLLASGNSRAGKMSDHRKWYFYPVTLFVVTRSIEVVQILFFLPPPSSLGLVKSESRTEPRGVYGSDLQAK